MPPTFSPYEIYQYLDSMLRHLPSDSLKTIVSTFLDDKQPVYYSDAGIDKRNHNGVT